MQLRSKKELIDQFIQRVKTDTRIEEDWCRFVTEQKENDLGSIIEEENLKLEETQRFISGALRGGVLKTTGTDLDRILPPVSRFGGRRARKKETVIDWLMAFF